MNKIFCDRSRAISYQRCRRLRWLEYHQDGLGIVSAKKSLPLVVGGSVHRGLEFLLRAMMDELFVEDFVNGNADARMVALEDAAVAAALADLAEHSGALELDAFERAAMQQQPDKLDAQLAGSLGMTLEEAGLPSVEQRYAQGMSQFDAYLAKEQAALVEAMVRAYARRRLRPLLEQFIVLEVEREGEWKLSEWPPLEFIKPENEAMADAELWFMSRPDALLLERESQQLYLLSFKTAASWDIRKEKDAQHDMQGLSEGVEVEKRLAEWWDAARTIGNNAENDWQKAGFKESPSPAMFEFLISQPSAPRILAIRMEFLLKGERWKDKELSAQLGMDCRSQRTPLVRHYVATSVPKGNTTFTHGDINWSWDYLRVEDMKESSLAWQNHKSQPVWERMSIREWIDLLDQSQEVMSGEDSTVGLEPRVLGWGGPAQKLGVTKQHPLDAVFIPPIVIYRNEDELRDLVEGLEAQEVEIAEAVAQIEAATDEGERRSLLNRKFQLYRNSCQWPSQCAMLPVCFGGDEIKRNPLGSGLYKIRTVNHPIELEGRKP
jgi:hypothetical protein